ncbi:MAG: amphi-Trp domain-containing protein [Desulfamplus sp.]|nr:amphi-Trp domain-containing protein [Desulfamplus sp.]
MSLKDEFIYESVQDTETITQYLKALVEGFERKQIAFNTNEKKIVLQPNNLIELEIKAKRGDGKNKLNLKFSWKDAPFNQSDHKSLEIHS